MGAENILQGRQYTRSVGLIFGQELSRRGMGIADLKLRNDYTPMETVILNRELGMIETNMDKVKKKHLRAVIKRAYSNLDKFNPEPTKSAVRIVYPKIKDSNMFLLNMVNGICTFFAEQGGTIKQLVKIITNGVTGFNIMDEFANIQSGSGRIVKVIKFIVKGEI